MADALRTTVEELFTTIETGDIAATLKRFADDAVLIDPHYPTVQMIGKGAIEDGLRWSFGVMRKMGFKTIKHFAADDGRSAAVEVDTSHVLRSGTRLNFRQVFVIETRDGLVTRLQAYEPYGPHGVGGLLLGVTRLLRRFNRRR